MLAFVTGFTTSKLRYPLGVANAAAQKQMHPRKKRRSSGSSGSASDMDPLPDTEDTSALPRKAAAKGVKGRGDRGKGKGGSTAKQQQAEVSKEPKAGGVCACVRVCV